MTAVKKMISIDRKPSRVIFTLRNDLTARKQRAANGMKLLKIHPTILFHFQFNATTRLIAL